MSRWQRRLEVAQHDVGLEVVGRRGRVPLDLLEVPGLDAELLRELEGHKPCKPCVSALNTFSLLAYDLCSHGQSR